MDLKELDVNQGGLRHPWEMSRARFFEEIVERWTRGAGARNALDIGSGDTWLAQQLLKQMPANSKMTCVDSSYTPEIVAKLKANNPVEMAKEIPQDQKFDVVFLLDVIEHIKDDRAFLENLSQNNMADDAIFVISVPAYQSLFSAHDTWLEHFRRYSPGEGRKLVRNCGLEILEEGGLFHGLLYARILQKFKELVAGAKNKFGVGRWEKGPGVTNFISGALNLDWKSTEALRTIGIQIPGLSWWCVCRKAL